MLDGVCDEDQALLVCPQAPGAGVSAYDTASMPQS